LAKGDIACRHLLSYSPGENASRCGSWEVHFESHFGGREGRTVTDGIIRQSDGGFLWALHCEHSAISNHSVVISFRISHTLKSTGWVTLRQNLGMKGLTGVSQNFNTMWENTWGLSYAKKSCR